METCYLTKLSVAIFIFRADYRRIKYSEKNVPVPLFLPQIPHILAWDPRGSPALKGRRIIAWAVKQPHQTLCEKLAWKCKGFLYCSCLATLFQLQRRVRWN